MNDAPSKPSKFPRWFEPVVILALLAMAVLESAHGQWLWGGIFGIAGISFGISLIARSSSQVTGDNDEH